MDEESIRQRLEGLTYRQLQLEAKENHVRARGKKEVLIENLLKKLLNPDASSLDETYVASETEGKTPQKKAVKAGARGTRLSADKEDEASQKNPVEDSAQTALLAFDEEKVETLQIDVAEDGLSGNKEEGASQMDVVEDELSGDKEEGTSQINHTEDGAHAPRLSGDEEKEETAHMDVVEDGASPMNHVEDGAHTGQLSGDEEKEQIPPMDVVEDGLSADKEEGASQMNHLEDIAQTPLLADNEEKVETPHMDVVEDELSGDKKEEIPQLDELSGNKKEEASQLDVVEDELPGNKEEEASQMDVVEDGLSGNKEEGASEKTHVEDGEHTARLSGDEEEIPQKNVVENDENIASPSAKDEEEPLQKNEDGANLPPLDTTYTHLTPEKEKSRENFSPTKAKLPSSPMKSPGAVRHHFNAIHQHAAEQLPDIEMDQQRKEERKECLTKSWTPRLNELSKPKNQPVAVQPKTRPVVTPLKKVPESPYKRRGSPVAENKTPSKKRPCLGLTPRLANLALPKTPSSRRRSATVDILTPNKKRPGTGLTYPVLTDRLENLAQPKTPPRTPSRSRRSVSVGRINYKPRLGAYQFVDTTKMSNEKFEEYRKQLAAQNHQRH